MEGEVLIGLDLQTSTTTLHVFRRRKKGVVEQLHIINDRVIRSDIFTVLSWQCKSGSSSVAQAQFQETREERRRTQRTKHSALSFESS